MPALEFPPGDDPVRRRHPALPAGGCAAYACQARKPCRRFVLRYAMDFCFSGFLVEVHGWTFLFQFCRWTFYFRQWTFAGELFIFGDELLLSSLRLQLESFCAWHCFPGDCNELLPIRFRFEV